MDATLHYYLVMGPPQHGKSTTANFIAQHTGGKFGSTSSIVFEELAHEMSQPIEALKAIPKEVLRPDLVRKGNELCSEDKAYLVKQLVSRKFNIIDGIRRIKELNEAEKFFQSIHANYTKLWIYNPKGPIISDNTELDATFADHVIVNSGSFKELETKVLTLLALGNK
jgi:hypothetical protein